MKNLKIVFIVLIFVFIPNICLSEGYTSFNYESISGKYPDSIKPFKQEMINKIKDKLTKIKQNNQTALAKTMEESLVELEQDTIAVFSNDQKSHLSITISKYESFTSTIDEDIQGFIDSMKRFNGEKETQIKTADLTIDNRNFKSVKVNPSYQTEGLISLFLVNESESVRYTILVLTEGESHMTEINTFFENLKFNKQ